MAINIGKILTGVLLNIFLVSAVSVVQEFQDIEDTYDNISRTVNVAVDSAVRTSLASEEFFSAEYGNAITSRSHAMYDNERYLYSTVKYMRNSQWIEGNAYILGKFAKEKGYLPVGQFEYDNYASGIDTEDIYEFLFGQVGSDHNHPSLSWANRIDSLYIYSPTGRNPQPHFKDFYDTVGKQIVSTQYVKKKAVDGTMNISEESDIPVLAQMGLKLSDYNEPTYEITSDNFTTVAHRGKKTGTLSATGVDENSIYYLTPYSLGVTYIPTDVYSVLLRTNFENLLRFSKCKVSPTSASFDDANLTDVYASADGCIDGSVYDDNIASANMYDHSGYSASIYNDGEVEYDLSTLASKIDYFVVDFYDNNNWKIVNEILGSTPNQDPKTLPSRLKATDTSASLITDIEDTAGLRVVARITTKVKLHIPYKNPILKWYAEGLGKDHIGVSRYVGGHSISDAGYVEVLDEGLWYTYTTYASISR